MYNDVGLNASLRFDTILATPEQVEVVMPISEMVMQPFGFVHGGATLALLEAAASEGAGFYADLNLERPFGIACEVRHVKSGREGFVRGVAKLSRIEGRKQIWDIAAYDDEGDVMSFGTFTTKVVTLERLAEKERERQQMRKRSED
ncbi:hotdog fold thioesterase [Eggerthellaceae bacterium zg-1084]|uniref:hotdog fold thioesterase n=1 Tax=Berryella wangjianweii TaxID=2734634 RepID=UPI001553B7D2|nr:hotdog fold thioesterase [Berryella wangjianweii]NPD31530.1 hotdog fold thioesterase [Berryella wangjianweii]NPD32975.1 hotdog fold thioesterase [Eggerthellaceae bacterium zg-997]